MAAGASNVTLSVVDDPGPKLIVGGCEYALAPAPVTATVTFELGEPAFALLVTVKPRLIDVETGT